MLEEELLRKDDVQVPEGYRRILEEHVGLVTEYNDAVSLMSPGDLESIWLRHVVDSLSLAPIIMRIGGPAARLLDIGSGAGFPGIPLKVVMPGLRLVLVERSRKRAGFLCMAVGLLGLGDVEVVHGNFPEATKGMQTYLITARAVERPERIMRGIRPLVQSGAVFLCQTGDPSPFFSGTFHVERIDDEWTRQGLRYGNLHIVKKM